MLLHKEKTNAFYLGRKSLDQQSEANFCDENELSEVKNHINLTLLSDNDYQGTSIQFAESLNHKNQSKDCDEGRKQQPVFCIERTAQKIVQEQEDNEAAYDERDLESLNFSQTKMAVERHCSSPEIKEQPKEERDKLKDEYQKLKRELRTLEGGSLKRKQQSTSHTRSQQKIATQLNQHLKQLSKQTKSNKKHKVSGFLNNASTSQSKSKVGSANVSSKHSRCSSQIIPGKTSYQKDFELEKQKKGEYKIQTKKSKPYLPDPAKSLAFGKSRLDEKLPKNPKSKHKLKDYIVKESHMNFYGKHNENSQKALGRNLKDCSHHILKDLNNASSSCQSLSKILNQRQQQHFVKSCYHNQESLIRNESCITVKSHTHRKKSKKNCTHCTCTKQVCEEAREGKRSHSKRRTSKDVEGQRKFKCRKCSKQQREEEEENINFATRSVDDRVSKKKIHSTCCEQKMGKSASSFKNIECQQLLQSSEEPLSPTKLNEELNKILETEKKIKQYKDMITQLQRDLYSKKPNQSNNSIRASLIQKCKVFQEDLTPSTSIKSLIRISQPAQSQNFEAPKNTSLINLQNCLQQISKEDFCEAATSTQQIQEFYQAQHQSKSSKPNHSREDSYDSSMLLSKAELLSQKKVETVIEEEQEEANFTQQQEKEIEMHQMEVQEFDEEKAIIDQKIGEEEIGRMQQQVQEMRSRLASQQQEIVNFYMEFQQEDQSYVTPLSTFSGPVTNQGDLKSQHRSNKLSGLVAQMEKAAENAAVNEGKPANLSSYESSNRWSQAACNKNNQKVEVLDNGSKEEDSNEEDEDQLLGYNPLKLQTQDLRNEMKPPLHIQQSADRGQRNNRFMWGGKKSSIVQSYSSAKRSSTPSKNKELDPTEMIQESQRNQQQQFFKNAITEYLAKPLSKKPPLLSSLIGTNSSRNLAYPQGGGTAVPQMESFRQKRQKRKEMKQANIPKPSISQGPTMYSKTTSQVASVIQKALATSSSKNSINQTSNQSSQGPPLIQLTIQKSMKNQNLIKCQTIDLTNIYNKNQGSTPSSQVQSSRERLSDASLTYKVLSDRKNMKRKGLQLGSSAEGNNGGGKKKWSVNNTNNFTTPITRVTLNM